MCLFIYFIYLFCKLEIVSKAGIRSRGGVDCAVISWNPWQGRWFIEQDACSYSFLPERDWHRFHLVNTVNAQSSVLVSSVLVSHFGGFSFFLFYLQSSHHFNHPCTQNHPKHWIECRLCFLNSIIQNPLFSIYYLHAFMCKASELNLPLEHMGSSAGTLVLNELGSHSYFNTPMTIQIQH